MRLGRLVALVVVVLVVAGVGIAWRLRSIDRLEGVVRMTPGDQGMPLLRPARWSDLPGIGRAEARRACDQRGARCAFPPNVDRDTVQPVLARRRDRVVWAFVATRGDVQYVTAVDAETGDVALAVAGPRRWTLERPPLGAGVTRGVPYSFHLQSHCGIRRALFDGRSWITDTPLNDGQGNPPNDWYRAEADFVSTMILLRDDLAEYRNRSYVVRFRPVDPSRDPPAPPCA